MSKFSFIEFTKTIRALAERPDAERAIHQLLVDTVREPEGVLAASATMKEDDTLFLEDQFVSVWRCRFRPHIVVPAHEHRMKVMIAGYDGCEQSTIYQRTEHGIEETSIVTVQTGEVVTLEKDAIHAVTAHGETPSQAIHVYFGPLMATKRDLFDVQTGTAVEFTTENYKALTRAR